MTAPTPIGPQRRPGRRAVLASLLLHGGLLAGAWLTVRSVRPPIDMIVYRVELVSPPPQVEGPPEPVQAVAPNVVTPDEAPPEPAVEEPKPEPEPPEPEPPEPKRETPPEPKPQAKAAEAEPKKEEKKPVAGESPDRRSTGGAGVNVKIEGEEFPDPGYLENVVLQLRRHFRWNGNPRLAACVGFWIRKDGSVGNLEVVHSSGDFRFDLNARGAVEAAGARDAFGPLPEAWPFDVLPVQFGFTPAGSARQGCPDP